MANSTRDFGFEHERDPSLCSQSRALLHYSRIWYVDFLLQHLASQVVHYGGDLTRLLASVTLLISTVTGISQASRRDIETHVFQDYLDRCFHVQKGVILKLNSHIHSHIHTLRFRVVGVRNYEYGANIYVGISCKHIMSIRTKTIVSVGPPRSSKVCYYRCYLWSVT